MKILPTRWARHIYDLFSPDESARLISSTPSTLRKNQLIEYLTILSERTGYAYPGNRKLSEKFGVSTRTIQRWLKDADERGLLTVVASGRSRRIYIGSKRKKEIVKKTVVSLQRHPVTPPRHPVAPIMSSSSVQDPVIHLSKAKKHFEIPPDASIEEAVEMIFGDAV